MATTGPDYYLFDELLTDAEREVRERVRRFCDTEVVPVINDYWERAEFPFELVGKLAGLGLAGGTLADHGGPGLSHIGAGMVAMELARGDGSVCTFFGVHSGLAMSAISLLGSEEQRARWLPAMARMELIGAFALTEPDHGSDAVALETRARRDGDAWVLDGSKRWIGNASFADLVIVWARDEQGKVGGYVVPKGTPGYRADVITGKTAKRAVWQADVRLDGVRIPLENRLAGSNRFKDTARVLVATRYGVAWEAVGHAMAAYEAALAYVTERQQFGTPLAAFQLVQSKLARMLAEITSMQLLTLRLGQHARQLGLDQLEAGQRRAELLPLLDVGQRRLVGGHRMPDRLPGDPVAGRGQHPGGVAEAVRAGQAVVGRDPDAV